MNTIIFLNFKLSAPTNRAENYTSHACWNEKNKNPCTEIMAIQRFKGGFVILKGAICKFLDLEVKWTSGLS